MTTDYNKIALLDRRVPGWRLEFDDEHEAFAAYFDLPAEETAAVHLTDEHYDELNFERLSFDNREDYDDE